MGEFQPKIRIFVTPVCPYCYTLKEFFKGKNFSFEEIDVSKDEKLLEEMIQKSGQMSVPVIEINGQIVVGFDKQKISEILKIKD